MLTCQSANQAKTPVKISKTFKLVSQFGSIGYTIMVKTADLTVVQKTIIDTLHKEGKPQTRSYSYTIWLQLSSEASYLG